MSMNGLLRGAGKTMLPSILVLFLAAAPAWAGPKEDWAVFQKLFLRETVSALSTLPETREHWRFVKHRQIDLHIVVFGESFGEEAQDLLGLYHLEQKALYLNKRVLEDAVLQLVRKGVPSVRLPRLLAWKILPVVAHEIRHAMMAWELKKRWDIEFEVPVLENEMIAWTDEVCVLQAVLAERPEFFKRSLLIDSFDKEEGLLLVRWQNDPGSLGPYLSELYPEHYRLIKADRKEMLKELEQVLADYQETADSLRAEPRSDDSLAMVRSVNTEETDEETVEWVGVGLRRFSAAVKTARNPRKFQLLKKYYAGQLKALSERCRSEAGSEE